MSLSVIIITYNEAANIGACLDSVHFADERVVLDGNSSDETVQIARAHGAKVVVEPNWSGFGIQKNRALALATCDWVLALDADERVTPELMQQLQEAMTQTDLTAYELPRRTQFCGQWIRHCGWSPDYVLRLFKRGHARFSDDQVHERVLCPTKVARLSAPLLHYSYPTPMHYWHKLQRYSIAWAEQAHARGRQSSIARAVTSAAWAFSKSYFLRLGFLDGSLGLAVCLMQAQAAFGKHFHLYCLNRHHVYP